MLPVPRCLAKKFLFALPLFVTLGMPLQAHALGSWNGWWPDKGAPSQLVEVHEFGANPGRLRMYKYVPAELAPGRPLVVALHGCTQQAHRYDDESGWIALADRYGFALLLPQETVNFARCFRWFDPVHSSRDQGEALSVRQMVNRMSADHRHDPGRVYVTGLSAGGAMTAVLLAAYPDVFAGGAVIAGIPYRCASNEAEAQHSCGLFGRTPARDKDMTPRQWGDLVRAASTHRGGFPRVSLWHGAADTAVHPVNLQELTEQWTDVHGIDQQPDDEQRIFGHLRRVYQDGHGRAMVETWLVEGIGHGTPIAPGDGEDGGRCGRAAPYMLASGICSSERIARFWGIDK